MISTILAKIEHTETADGENIFCWSPVQEPTEYKIYRTAGSEGLKRNIDDISSYEILNAATEVLNQQGSIGKDDLIKETANKGTDDMTMNKFYEKIDNLSREMFENEKID